MCSAPFLKFVILRGRLLEQKVIAMFAVPTLKRIIHDGHGRLPD